MSSVQPTLQSLDCAATLEQPRPLSRTVEYWLQTVIWTALAMLACVVAYCIEKYGFRLKELGLPRMFFNPAEIAMRIFGLPHFMVGLFFMLTARRMRTVSGWAWFVGLLAVGIAFAWLFHRYGAHRSPVMLIIFYFYFLVHGFRDEAFFYRNYGDCPTDAGKPHKLVMFVLQLMLISLLLAFLMPTYLLVAPMYGQKIDPQDPVLNLVFPASVPFLIKFAWYLLPVLAINAGLYYWLERRYPGGWRAIWQDHHPILMVFLWSTVIVLATLLVGAWTFNFVVLAHFVGWYLFSLRKLETLPPSARATPRQPLRWMRTTRAGFMTLHLGLAAVVAGLIAIATYKFGNTGTLEAIVGGPSFYYWTVLHVSLSFYPRT